MCSWGMESRNTKFLTKLPLADPLHNTAWLPVAKGVCETQLHMDHCKLERVMYKYYTIKCMWGLVFANNAYKCRRSGPRC